MASRATRDERADERGSDGSYMLLIASLLFVTMAGASLTI